MKWRLAFQILGLIAAVFSLLPLIAADYWWIRVFDYPHLQFTAFTLAAIILSLFTFKWRWYQDYIFLAILVGCFAFQCYKIIRFTPLVPVELKDSSANISSKDQLRLYTANVLQTNTNRKALFEEITQRQPDVVVFTETDQIWMKEIRKALSADYPYKVEEPLENTYGIILYSKLPLRETSVQFMVDPEIPSIHTQVKLRNGDWFQLYAIHPTPPMPQENPSSSDRDTELMKIAIKSYQSTLPVIVLGDFNDVAWSSSTELTETIGKLLDLRVGRGFYNSYHAQYPMFRWALDHILIAPEFRLSKVGRGVNTGSDHFPTYAYLTYEPDLAHEQEPEEPSMENWKSARDQMSKQGLESFSVLPDGMK
ncbi:endonuclease/exonuclease/phosphatase family protein [Nonlabens antarcticus]|uniref:endonuclease/exonuclease/phosphatase family protein n=1 Tax=Nonlabens antarcticus TaxID=392714 RepID=UPI001891DEE6|nr:endonuclease/exonuclease/phosphatase family protein [Nonlabens antarcticus]